MIVEAVRIKDGRRVGVEAGNKNTPKIGQAFTRDGVRYRRVPSRITVSNGRDAPFHRHGAITQWTEPLQGRGADAAPRTRGFACST